MIAYFLVDFFNLDLWRAGRDPTYRDLVDGLDSLVAAGLKACARRPIEEMTVRLYGGWFDGETKSATSTKTLLDQIIPNFPKRSSLQKRTRIRIQLAESPFSLPALRLSETLRMTPFRSVIGRVVNNPDCAEPSNCPTLALASWLKGRCPTPGCSIKTSQVTAIRRQKIVDTLICTDAIQIAGSKQADIVVFASDDDDMLPGVLGAKLAGVDVIALFRREYEHTRYSHLLESLEIVYAKW